MTPIETTTRQATSALEGTLCSMHTPNIATHTGTDARITCAAGAGALSAGAAPPLRQMAGPRAWFIESSITVSDALLHAIWKPFIVAIATRPFQSLASTSACREL